MLKIIVSGCNGHMGQSVVNLCSGMDDVEIPCGFNRTPLEKNGFPVYSVPGDYAGEADVVIDFSNPANLTALLEYCVSRQIPAVLCTTGYSEQQLAEIEEAGKKVPLFKSGNMSLGINLMMRLVRKAAAVLGGNFDVEILERHHNRKLDAPSGTALMLADAAAEALPYQPEYVYERHSVRQKRRREEIGISSIRGGTIVGEHEVIFAGADEVFTLRHEALSREVFASGAIAAAKYIASVKEPGIYDMDDLLGDI